MFWQRSLPALMRTGLDMLFLYLLLFPVYMDGPGYPPPVLYTAVTLIGAGVFFTLLFKFKPAGYALSVVPVMIGGAWLGGFHIGTAAIIVLFLFWRLISHMRNEGDSREVTVLILSLIVGTVYYLLLSEAPSHQAILYVMIAHFFATAFVLALNSAIGSGLAARQLASHLRWTAAVFGAVAVLGLVAGLFTPVLAAVFFAGFRILLLAGGYLMMPFAYFLSMILPENTEEEVMENPSESEGDGESFFPDMEEVDVDETFIGSIAFFWMVGGLLLAGGFLYALYRLRKDKETSTASEHFQDEPSHEVNQLPRSWETLRNILKPEQEVRRHF
ncbi:hypothetical protein CR205_00275 [Alteribacter lacisalsi]|uniref:Uncharacterized protein n=1 Tax=Alteribacter lacisalsi TaxID=2045244 RepID=A0A2W0HJV3_9BACI|nr:hypothetical protein [Alteribacter lacisalsi]PYZ97079.1 hypothetical protein CR205_00275 [Alteribacter lacisalsi]